MEAALARQVSAGVNSQVIASTACAAWSRVHDALAPIVGRQGMSALFKRSLHLARVSHPALAGVAVAETAPGDFSALHTVLASHGSAADAAALNAALLTTFCDLLYSLIGATLTEQLLTPVWAHPSIDAPAQDHST